MPRPVPPLLGAFVAALLANPAPAVDLVKAGKKAGDLVNRLAAISGGKGGGRPGFASAGAGDPAKLGAVREAAPGIIDTWLGA